MKVGLLMLAFVLAMSALVFAAEDEAPRCDNCGMFFEKSPTRVSATIDLEDESYTHIFECFGCLHDFVHENYGEVMPSELSVLDYNTFATDGETMLDAFEAFYLFDTERIKGSMAPYVAAFADEEAAKAAQETLGGELTDFAGMKKLMMNAKGEEMEESHEGHGHDADTAAGADAAVYVCSCTGGCCDDIQASEPGECSRCGMTLVKQGS
jgi:nitrous oxide reductase accessory protein NosL